MPMMSATLQIELREHADPPNQQVVVMVATLKVGDEARNTLQLLEALLEKARRWSLQVSTEPIKEGLLKEP